MYQLCKNKKNLRFVFFNYVDYVDKISLNNHEFSDVMGCLSLIVFSCVVV